MSKVGMAEMQLAGTRWLEYLISFRIDMESRGLSRATIENYYVFIGQWGKWFREQGVGDLTGVTKGLIQKWVIQHRGSVSDHTINTRLRHLRAFLAYLHREGVVPEGGPDTSRYIKLIKAERGAKPVVSPEQIGRVLRGLTRRSIRRWAAYRELAMVLVFWDCMIRLGELRGLRVSDVNFNQKTISVLGKGRKRRTIPVGDRTLKILNKWVIHHRGSLSAGDWLFTSEAGGQLTCRNIHLILSRLGVKYKLKRFNPHLLRHSAATWWMSQPGANIEILRRVLGHSSILVTQQYLHLGTSQEVEAYSRMAPSQGLDF